MGLGTAVVCVDDVAKGNGTASELSLQCVFGHATNDLFRQVSGIILSITFQHRFQNDAFRPMVFAISWWASVVLVYNSLMVAVMGCMRIRLTGLYTASTTATSTTTIITARQPHGTCHAAPK